MVTPKTVPRAGEHAVTICAGPGCPDLLGCGRCNMETFAGEIKNYSIYEMAASARLRVVRGSLPYRACLSNGRLAPRTLQGAVIHDPDVVRQCLLAPVTSGRMACADGREIKLEAQTLCILGDTPDTRKLARAAIETLNGAGVCVAFMAER